jgi:hypothetical protein
LLRREVCFGTVENYGVEFGENIEVGIGSGVGGEDDAGE